MLIRYFLTETNIIHPRGLKAAKFGISTRKMAELTRSSSSNPQERSLIDIIKKNPKRYQRIQFLADLFKSGGYELRIAGGAVRDILRFTDPQDIDFATTARPEESLKLVSKHEDILRIIVTAAGQKHGTVAVKFKEVDQKRIKLDIDESLNKPEDVLKAMKKPEYDDESPFEITTLRCDTVTDGRHAEVQFVNDWKTDAERRDLTINAMFLTLDTGELVDYFNGESDLKNGIVRFVGDPDKRIKEDYLRILRFFRFWSRYGRKNSPDQVTEETLIRNLGGLNNISGERILTEIKKILSYPPYHDVVALMLKIRLHHHIGVSEEGMNDVEYTRHVLQELEQVESNIAKFKNEKSSLFKRVDKKVSDLMPMLLLSSFLRSSEALDIAHERMKFSNLERDTIRYIIDSRVKTLTLKDMKKQLALANNTERFNLLSKMIAFNIFRGEFDIIEELLDWNIPLFPMPGSEVSKQVQLQKLPPYQTKIVISYLKNTWADSDFTLSKSELKDMLEVRLIEMKGE